MDLVKIGFLIQTNGLEKANKEVDALLAKADRLKNLGAGKGSSAGSNSGSAGGSPSASTKTTEKMIKQQELLAHFLPLMDKQTAALAAKFKALSDSTAELNKYLTLVGQNKAFLKQQESAERLIAAQKKLQEQAEKDRQKAFSKEQQDYQKRMDKAKASVQSANEAEEKARQKRLSAEQKYYQKQMEMARAAAAGKTTAEEKARQKKLADEQKYYQKQMDAAKKEHAATVARQQKLVDDAEKARQQNFKAAQDYYQKQMALAQAEQTAKNKQAQKLLENEEKARQKRLSAEQKHYQQQMELARKAAESEAKAQKRAQEDADKARQRRFAASQNHYQQEMARIERLAQAERDRISNYNKQIALTNKIAQNQRAGLSTTNASKLARMELSGADAATVERYKKALLSAQAATQSLGNTTTEASKKLGFWNSQIGGIVKYAILSTAIYGVMTAMTALTAATVRMADEYTAIQNRMKLYITDAEELIGVNQKLTEFAMANNVGLRETATLFTRLAPSMQRLGKDTGDITTVVDAFGKSLRIGGATAMEAASATIQFSQAMASGKLAGDEFRSISEASPRFLKAIADGSGIAASKLKEMSSAGLLTTEVISNALIKEYGKLSAENLKLGVTLEQGSNAIVTAFTRFIGEFNEGAGVTKFFGESLMDVALSLSDLAKTAKESGESMKQWLTDNKKNIELLGNAALLAASIFAGRLVASLVATTVSAVRAKVSVLALNVSIAMMGTTARGAALAVTTLSTSLKGLFRLMGGWVGIAVTLATAYLGFKSLEKGASEATQELISQNKYISMTTDELKALGVVQKDLAKFKLNLDMAEAEKNVKAAKDNVVKAFDEIIYKWHFISKSDDVGFVKQYDEIVASVKNGTMSFDLAVKKLIEMNAVTEDVAKELYKMTGEYDKTVDSALPFVKVLKDLGVEHKITKDATHNGRTENDLYKKSLGDIADQARDTENALGGLAAKYKAAADVIRGGMQVSLVTGIKDKQLSEELYKDANERAKLLKGTAVMMNPSGVTAEQVLKSGLFKDEIDQQKELYKLQKQSSDFYKESAEAKQSEVNNYPKQLEQLNRFLSILKNTSDIEVARVASTKEYHKWYKGNLDVARQIVALEKQRSEIEKEIQDALAQETARADYVKALRTEEEVMTRITLLMDKGVDYEVARQVAQAYYTDNARGIAAASLTYMNTLNSSLSSLESQVVVQEQVNAYMREGVDLERATFNATLDRAVALGTISEESAKAVRERQKELSLTSQAQQEERKRLESASKMRKDITDLALQAMVLAMTQDSAIADIINGYEHIDSEAAKELSTRQLIIDKLKEQYDYQKAQKANPLGDFSNINFDAFGDFGNPFKSALEGLNAMIAGTALLDQQYGDMHRDLNKQWNEAAANSIERTQIETQRATLEQGYIREKAALNDEAVSKMLSASKQFFKEESAGYKVLSAAEKAFTVFKLVQGAKRFAIEMGFITKETGAYVAGSLSKKAAELGFTAFTVVQKGIQAAASGVAALASSMAGLPFPLNIAAFAATGALLASIGLNLAGGGKASGSFALTNEGTGTVFGDPTAKSESIKKSIDLLAENSDVTTPLTAAMLKSLQNIESNIGGLANLLIRNAPGSKLVEGVNQGFKQNTIGGFLEKAGKTAFAAIGDFLGINKMLGSLLGGLFGKKVSVKGQGLFGSNQQLGDIIGDGFSLQEYVDIQTKKKSFGITTSKKNSTQYSAASQELENQFTLIFKSFNDAILSAAPILDKNTNEVAKKLNDFVVSIGRVDLKGLNGEQIQEKLNAVFGAEADKMAQAALGGLDDFQKVGEGYFETLVRVATSIEMATVYTDRLNVSAIKYTDVINKQGDVTTEIIRQSVLLNESNKDIKNGFYDLVNTFNGTAGEITDFVLTLRDLQDAIVATGKSGDYLTSAMLAGAGGLDRLQDGLEAYFEILSPAEQAAELTRRLTNEFAVFGTQVPASVDAFKALVNGIDINTEAGQKLYGQVVALTPEFVDLQDSLKKAEDAAKAEAEEARRLAEEAKKAAESLAKLRTAFFITGQDVSRLTQVMINAAGGVEAMQRGLDAMFEMLSPTEKAAELTRRLAIQFKALGLELPSSTDAFRVLVKEMNTSTNAGKALLGKVIALAPEFNELQKALESANNEVNQLVQSLRDLAEQARQARGETEQPRNLDYARAMFESTAMLAMQGDTQAAEKLMSLGTNLMDLSKQYSTSGSEYARDLAWIQRAATISADVQEGGLGYTSTTLSTSLSGGNAAPTLATTSTSTDAEIKELRGDLNAALLAIAKYTQSTANKLENWDDGNRVMVGVIQERDDPKLKVVTT